MKIYTRDTCIHQVRLQTHVRWLLKFVNDNFQNNYGNGAIVINSAQIYNLDEITI